MHANRAARPRVYDAREIAERITTTFKNRPVEYEERLPFHWPAVVQHVGDSLGEAYDSDKWKSKGFGGRRERELYKHLAESRHRALVVPGMLFDEDEGRVARCIGPKVSLADWPMPADFSIMAKMTEVDLCLFTRLVRGRPAFGPHEDDGCVAMRVPWGMLGGGMILWSRVSDEPDEPFLFVYDRKGIVMLIVGDQLDIEADGIVG